VIGKSYSARKLPVTNFRPKIDLKFGSAREPVYVFLMGRFEAIRDHFCGREPEKVGELHLRCFGDFLRFAKQQKSAEPNTSLSCWPTSGGVRNSGRFLCPRLTGTKARPG
jgi:hypothetical protein